MGDERKGDERRTEAERLTGHVLPDKAGECTRGRPFACFCLSLLLHAVFSYFPLPPGKNPENVFEIMPWLEHREE